MTTLYPRIAPQGGWFEFKPGATMGTTSLMGVDTHLVLKLDSSVKQTPEGVSPDEALVIYDNYILRDRKATGKKNAEAAREAFEDGEYGAAVIDGAQALYNRILSWF